MKVLIIDDSPDALRLAQHHLVPEGLEVRCADSGKAGLEMATREGPDLILLDVDMPGLSGLDVCRVLKDDAKLCMVPVIFLSGSGGPDDKIAGLCGRVVARRGGHPLEPERGTQVVVLGHDLDRRERRCRAQEQRRAQPGTQEHDVRAGVI